MKLWAQIQKMDEDQRMVWGYASTGSRDSHDEIVAPDAIKTAWDDYMKFANIREMHQPSAVGIVKEYSFDDNGVMIGAKIVDDTAWEKVKEQVYKGFSIGGKKLPGGYDPITKTITALQLTEISLVDRPANPESLITMYKLADQPEGIAMSKKAGTTPVDELLDLLSKDASLADSLLKVARETLAKADDKSDEDKKKEGSEDAKAKAKAKAEDAKDEDVKDDAAKADEKSKDDKKPAGKEDVGADEKAGGKEKRAEKSVEPSALRKSIKALGAKGDDVAKSMWQVADFADMIQALQWLADGARYEREVEGDSSPIPEKIDAAIGQLAQVFLEMAVEELKELQPMAGGGSYLEHLTLVIANSEAAPTLRKFNDALDIIKEGRRNNTEDQERIQKAHDVLVELGAECAQVEKANVATDLKKDAPAGNDIAKMAATVEKMAAQMGKDREDLKKASGLIADLQKQIAAIPATPKGSLKTVEKSAETAPQNDAEVKPVLKADGTVDEAATAIKKVHAGGGRLSLGQR